jgi:chromosome segregation ATPase
MMIEIDQQKYGFLFAERLEKTFHEQIRKTIDLEVKISALLEFAEEEKRKQNELTENTKHHEQSIKNAMDHIEELAARIRQYDITIEEMTKNNSTQIDQIIKHNAAEISNYSNRIADIESELNRNAELKTKFEHLNYEKELRIEELEREMNRLNQELQITFNDFQDLKNSIKEEPKKIINKAKKPVVDDGIF